MLRVANFISLLVGILLFCHETDGQGTITWNEPPPKETTADFGNIQTYNTQLVEGSTNVPLRWDFNLASDLYPIQSVEVELDNVRVVNIAPNLNISEVIAGYKDRFNLVWNNPTRATVTIVKVSFADEGIFACVVSTVGTGSKVWKRNINVTVVAPPMFTNRTQDQTVNETTNLLLFCYASGKPTPKITWTRVLEDGSNSEVLHRGTTWNFPNINASDAGTYRCTADNGAGSPVSHTVTVIVKFSPRITLDKKHYVSRGAKAYLHCQVEAYPQPTISWVPCNLQESVCDSSFLNISNVTTPRANYTCTATNGRGQDSETTTLVIGGTKVYISMTIITNEKCTEGASWRKQIVEEMGNIFTNRNGYSSAEVVNCRVGSVILDLGLMFGMSVAEDFVISTIQSAIQGGRLGQLSVDASSIIGIPPVITSTTAPPTSPTPPKSGDNKTLIIVLSVIGGVLFLVLVAVVVACCIRMKNKKDSREVDDHKGRKDGGQPSGPPPGAPGQNNTDYEEPGYASTSSAARTKKDEKDGKKSSKKKDAQQEEMPMYAQIDKSKKKPKPNSYSEVERPDRREPEIQYAVMDHSHPGGSMPRGAAIQPRRAPETVYADLV